MASERSAALRGLYAVTAPSADTEALAAAVAACIDGGARLVQYRAKDAPPERALAQARRLARVCAARGVPLIVNDSVELARAAGAHGVHLGRDDAAPHAARAALPDGIIGVSCYDEPGRAGAAAAAGADYVAIGAVFPSTTKPAARQAPLALIAAAKAAGGLPVAAIGGVTLANARQAIDAGADMVAVISALFAAADPAQAARAFASLFADDPKDGPDAPAQPRPV